MTGDARALNDWSEDIVRLYASGSRPAGGTLSRVIAYPRWGATVFYRKSQEIGFAGASRLAFDAVTARLKARR